MSRVETRGEGVELWSSTSDRARSVIATSSAGTKVSQRTGKIFRRLLAMTCQGRVTGSSVTVDKDPNQFTDRNATLEGRMGVGDHHLVPFRWDDPDLSVIYRIVGGFSDRQEGEFERRRLLLLISRGQLQVAATVRTNQTLQAAGPAYSMHATSLHAHEYTRCVSHHYRYCKSSIKVRSSCHRRSQTVRYARTAAASIEALLKL